MVPIDPDKFRIMLDKVIVLKGNFTFSVRHNDLNPFIQIGEAVSIGHGLDE